MKKNKKKTKKKKNLMEKVKQSIHCYFPCLFIMYGIFL
jgi:hypothetical protein